MISESSEICVLVLDEELVGVYNVADNNWHLLKSATQKLWDSDMFSVVKTEHYFIICHVVLNLNDFL